MGRGKHVYDPRTLQFVRVKPDRFRQAGVMGAIVLVLAVGVSLIMDRTTSTVEEFQLRAENAALLEQAQLDSERLERLEDGLSDLEEMDREMYRVMLSTEDIPYDVRQVGVGGTDPHERFDQYSESAAALLRGNSTSLDELERRIALQNASYRDLMGRAQLHDEKTRQLPAIRPIETGRFSSRFGRRLHPILGVWHMHDGVDLTTPTGTPVYATGGGVIERIDSRPNGYGLYVVIRHPAVGLETLYAHLSEVAPGLRLGQRVERGEQIGLSGNTGLSTAPHVHYEVRKIGGASRDPISYFAPDLSPAMYKDVLLRAARAENEAPSD